MTDLTPLDITIAIPAKNESLHLGKCLESIGHNLAKEIVVIDSNSTDDTQKIARDAGATVLNFNWNGRYPKKRNWYLENHKPQTKWVLFLDADEHLTPEFKKELRDKLTHSKNYGYWIPYSIYIRKKKLSAGYPLRKLALFRVGFAAYEQIDERNWSTLDMEIHEHALVNGNVDTFKQKIEHRVELDNLTWERKHREYAKWEFNRYLKITESPARIPLNLNQKIKYMLLTTPWAGSLFFIGSFFLMAGFKDGSRGYEYARLKMGYFNLIYQYIKEFKN